MEGALQAEHIDQIFGSEHGFLLAKRSLLVEQFCSTHSWMEISIFYACSCRHPWQHLNPLTPVSDQDKIYSYYI